MFLTGKSIENEESLEIEIQGDVIRSIKRTGLSPEDLPYVSAGFIDMQVNGFNGNDYSMPDLDGRAIDAIIRDLARSGVTQHVPTFVSLPEERLLRNLAVLAAHVEQDPSASAAICAFHVEGPFISPEDGARGAHDKAYIRKPDFEEFLRWQDAARGRIAYVTVAPEVENMIAFIDKVVESGVKVAIGHTEAAPPQIKAAIDAGASLSTHLGNGSPAVIPRLENFLWEQLASDDLWASLICDGFHLPRAAVKVILRAKGLDRLILVSDAAMFGGFSPGLYRWGEVDVQVFDDRHLGLPGTSMLAGAAHLLDWDIAHFIELGGVSLAGAVGLCTKNPVSFLGLQGTKLGSLEAGAPANICSFRYVPGEGRLAVRNTIRAGRLVYSSEEKAP
jgi:N-acetylglucosamine-6-phosphate deacetylase